MKKQVVLLCFCVALAACGKKERPAQTPLPPPSIPAATAIETDDVLEPDVEAVVEVSAKDLMDKTPAEVVSMMGEPSLVRRLVLMQSMLFDAKNCVVDVVFYAEKSGEPYKASHVLARDKQGGDVNVDVCLKTAIPNGWRAEIKPQLDILSLSEQNN